MEHLYTIAYWCSDLSEVTGHKQGDSINDEQLMQLIHNCNVNTMIQHGESTTICWIDNKRFQQR